MNEKRRKRIRAAIKLLNGSNPDLEDIKDELEDLLAEEEESMENMPESLQDTDRYMTMEESCGYLQDAIDELDGIDEEDPDYSDAIKVLEGIDGV